MQNNETSQTICGKHMIDVNRSRIKVMSHGAEISSSVTEIAAFSAPFHVRLVKFLVDLCGQMLNLKMSGEIDYYEDM